MMSINIWKTINPTKKNVNNLMIADMKANKKKLSPIVAEFFFRRKKLNNSLVFISQSYFKD